ncbi:precorrin-6Y C5,15-methyltransferase (decarboxylating) [Desulfonauticus submarinus]|uniref:Precorrin-6Y C5,15-methyltransferase (Decarboxylating) n=1 Tax=Desulfonauticus submarinus TaxID=206665 RepID=A0A1H0BKS3_9BACT|nr:cobalt-precorrin-7 (C(5))-methyltransferase [Desulfonauticus submarinus]SDN46254.1 precorrin-6Y C5,15-methyltransferase (decarboxylating) [Desulfonauticus submarinus]
MKLENKIVILGCGPGSPEYVLPVVRQKLFSLEVIVGSKRLLNLFPEFKGEKYESVSIKETLYFLDKARMHRLCGVLISGSPLYFSLASLIVNKFGQEACEIIPGISAADIGLAKLGLVGKRVHYFSVHGRRPDFGFDSLNNWEVVVIFLGKDWDWLEEVNVFSVSNFTWFFLENLTLPSERILKIKEDKLPQILNPSLLIGIREPL